MTRVLLPDLTAKESERRKRALAYKLSVIPMRSWRDF